MPFIFRYFIFSLLAGAMLISSCSDDPDPLPPDPTPSGPIIDISGFTLTDEQGQLTSTADPTDWQLDDEWQDEVSDLFSSTDDLCAPNSEYSIIAYPNPAPNGFALAISMPASSSYNLRLVDEDLNEIFSVDDFAYLDLPFAPFSNAADTLRLYYEFVDASNCVFRGHGDIITE